MKPKPKKDYNAIENDNEAFEKYLKNFVIQTLRRASYRWFPRSTAKSRQRIERGFYKCEACQGSFGNKHINLDHTEPVVDIQHGMTSWDDYINRLFVKSTGFSVLCETCHESKTTVEAAQRKVARQKAKKK